MTDSERLAYVRQRIAQDIVSSYCSPRPIDWEELPTETHKEWLRYADAILSLQDEHGPLLAVLAEDQSTTECCPRCEGNGEVYADGKAHLYSEQAPTIHCPLCAGTGRIMSNESGFRRVIL